MRRKDEQKKIWLKQSLCLKSEDTNCALCVSVLFYCYFRSHLLIRTECATLALIWTFRFQVIKTQNDLKILLKSLKEQKKKKLAYIYKKSKSLKKHTENMVTLDLICLLHY